MLFPERPKMRNFSTLVYASVLLISCQKEIDWGLNTGAAKGIQRIVNRITFNNVIELDYRFTLDNPFGRGKNYYAKGIGAIESFYTIGYLTVNISDTTKLTSYTIQ